MNASSSLAIVGMHRSGTSLTAQWITRCGLHLGDRLMDGGMGNPEGHYEDLDFHDFHEDVFRDHDIPYGGLMKTQPIKLTPYFKSRLKAMIDYKSGMATHWGWKEPRTCLFLEHHHEFLTNPHYLILFRSADQVIGSLWRRYQKLHQVDESLEALEAPHLQQLVCGFIDSWIQYNENILTFIKKLNPEQYRIHSINELLESDGNVIDWLNKAGFKLEKVPFHDIFDPYQFSQKECSPPYTNEQSTRIKTIEDQFSLTQSKEGKYKELEGVLVAKNSTIISLETTIEDLTSKLETERDLNSSIRKENSRLHESLESKEQLIQSAIKWQKSWLNRSLHKWRPHEQVK